MFKKFMAKLGVGSAKIDFVLKKDEYALGETIEGEFRIEGGNVDQEINKIDLDLNLRLLAKGKEFNQTITSIPVQHSFIIRAQERKVIPFTYELPMNLLVSRGPVSYYFTTRLDIAAGVDNLDKDYIKILPPVRFNNLIEALGRLGFREKMDSGKFDGSSQEFEFFPTSHFNNHLSELEFVAALEDNGIRILLELDLRTAFGFGEKELKRELFFSNEELGDVQLLSGKLEDIINEMIQNPHEYPASRYKSHYGGHHHHHGHGRHGSGLAGAMGGFAAGMFGGMLLGELLSGDEEMDFAGGEEDAYGGMFDFFGGDGGDDEF